MPMNSVNTNVGAMVALQNLNKTNTDLNTTQNRINTGLKVGSAKDNGAVWAIAQNQRSNSGALNAVKESLSRSISTVDVALSAGESVSDLLLQMKEKSLAASDTTLDAASRTALNDDFKALRDQLAKVVTNAEFNGANMIKATTPTTVEIERWRESLTAFRAPEFERWFWAMAQTAPLSLALATFRPVLIRF